MQVPRVGALGRLTHMLTHLTTSTRDGRALALRPLRAGDALRIQQACSDPETVRWLGSAVINEQYDLDDAQKFIRFTLAHVEDGSLASWAVADATSDDMLGHLTLTGWQGDLSDTAALGYWTHPVARGRGVTTVAARAVVAHALTPASDGGAGLRRLTARVAVGNVASQRVLEATGFTRTGQTRQSDALLDGTYTDEYTYDRLVTDPTWSVP